jgi:transposase
MRRYRSVEKEMFPGLRAFESRAEVFGHDRRVVLTHSQNLHDKQVRGFEQTMAKARRQLAEVSARLKRGKGRKSREQVEAEIAQILKPRWLIRVISTTLSGEEPSELRLVFRTKPKALAELHAELFGKRILFTDHDDWTISQVVSGYRSQECVEGDFRQMKDPKVVSFSPMFHWTDQKIRVHVAHCVLALMTARLMVREAANAGIPMSVRELLSTLAGIEESVMLFRGERGRPRARRMLTEMDPVQSRLYELFGLEAYAPEG